MSFFPEVLLTTDAHQYAILARNMLMGNGYTLAGRPELIFPPGYSILLTPFVTFVGDPTKAVLTMMYLSWGLLLLGSFLLFIKLFTKKTALLSTLIIMINGNFLLGTINGYSEILMYCFVILTLLFLIFNKSGTYLVSGICTTVAFLIKPEAIAYVAMFLMIRWKNVNYDRNMFLYLIPVVIGVLTYSTYLWMNTGKIAISGKMATLEWDKYIENPLISRESIMYKLNPDKTLGPSLKNYNLNNIDFRTRILTNLKAAKQTLFELLLPFKLVLAVILFSMLFRSFRNLFFRLVLLCSPITLTLFFHVENRYFLGLLLAIIVYLSAIAINNYRLTRHGLLFLFVRILAVFVLIQLSYYSSFPLRKELPELIEQRRQAIEFLDNNKVEGETILARKPMYSFLSKKDYYPIPYTDDKVKLVNFVNDFSLPTIILDRWDYLTMPKVHQIIKAEIKDKQVLVFKNWD